MNNIKKNRMLWLISKRWFFPSPCWKHVGIFFRYLLWESSWVPGGKSHNIMGARLRLGLSGVFNSQELSTLSLQPFMNYSSGFLPRHWFAQWFPLLGLWSGKLLLSVFVCLSPILGAEVCPMSSSLLWIQDEMLIFQSVQHFTCWEPVVTSMLLTCRTITWKSSL